MSSRRKRDQKRKLRFLRSQYKFFSSSLFEIKKDLESYESEWVRDISFISKEINVSNRYDDIKNSVSKEQKDEPNISANGKVSPPKWAKSLYKRIARKTHPDKIKNIDDIDKMSNIFQKASKTMESGDYENLFDIAIELGISLDIDDSEMILRLTQLIEKLKKEISDIEKSVPWLWGESFGVMDARVKIAISILKNKGAQFEEIDIIKIINKIESKN